MKLNQTIKHYPLSSNQREIWFDQMLHPSVPLYNIGGYRQVDGAVDPKLFERAINLLVQRHDALRTVLIPGTSDLPMQTFLEDLSVTVPVHDFSGENNPHQSALTWMQQKFVQPFELYEKPLFQFALLKITDNCFFCLEKYHHLIVDGWSISLITQSLADIYTHISQGQSVEISAIPSYLPFVNNDRAYIESERYETHRQYWLEKYSTLSESLFAPRYLSQFIDKISPSERRVLSLARPFYNQLIVLSKKCHATTFHLILGALYVYFTRTTQTEELAVGLPVLNRPNAAFKNTVGLFVGVSAARFAFGTDLSFKTLLQNIGRELKQNYRYQRLPISELNRELGLLHQVGRKQLFDLSVSYEKHDYDVSFDAYPTQAKTLLHGYEQTPLKIYVREFHDDEDVDIDFVYNLAYFEAAEIELLQSRFVLILEYVLAHVDDLIGTIPLLTETEKQQLLAWNKIDTSTSSVTDYPVSQTIVDLFQAQVEKTPDNIAVVFENQQLTYQQLNRKANQLAHYLMTLEVKAETLVGICVERSVEMVIGLLGILKAGGAYVPLDPDYPKERLQFMLEDSAVPVLLSQSSLLSRLPVSTTLVICLDREWEQIAVGSGKNPMRQSGQANLAYMIYTSGSTGMPKGVMIEQKSLLNYLDSMLPYFDKVGNFALVSTLAADLGHTVIFPSLCIGGSLHVLSFEKIGHAKAFMAYLNDYAIDYLKIVPSHLAALQTTSSISLPCQRLILGGEASPVEWIKTLQIQNPACRILNHYGPTEATVGVLTYEVNQQFLTNQSTTLPLGRPLKNTQIFILNNAHQPVPIGVAGELCISGAGLARGYLNRPELTQAKFIELELFGQHQRIYKTGDLARYRTDGNLEYLGRIDNQVKIRGFRVELGETETVLGQYPLLRENAVIVHETKSPLDESSLMDKRLVAYLVPYQEQVIDQTALRRFLSERLPDYMIPSAWVTLETLPLTPNGKIDRQALLQLSVKNSHLSSDGNYVAPRTDEEALLASIWAEVLGVKQVGIYDNFFELGGHSLLATQVMSRVHDRFEVEIEMRDLFEYSNLADLSKRLTTVRHQISLPPFKRVNRSKPLALSSQQQSMWFLYQQSKGKSIAYNVPAALHLEGSLHVDALERSLQVLVERHESLRTCFPVVNGNLMVQILPTTFQLGVLDLSHLSPFEQERELQHLINEESQFFFDLKKGPLFRARLLKLNAQNHRLLVNMHHIISDGWSNRILMQKWQRLYQAFSHNQPSPLPALAIQYVDFANWQSQWMTETRLEQQVTYWKQQLADAPSLLTLPTDKPRPAVPSFQGAHLTFTLSSELTAQLKDLSRQTNSTLFMTLFSAFAVLLSRYSGQSDILIGSPIANRNHSQIEHLVGLFINTIVLRLNLANNPPFKTLLQQTRRVALEAYAHQDLPFEQVIRELKPDRHLSYSPLFQVMFVLNQPRLHFDGSELKVSVSIPDNKTAKFDLNLLMEESEQSLAGTFEYNTDLFQAATIARMLEHLKILLQSVTTNSLQPIGELPLLTTAEKKQLIAWNQTETDYPVSQTIVDLFQAQVQKKPDNIAVVFKDQQLSYQTLNIKANQLAHYLMNLGVGVETLVGICVERSLSMVIGLLGILKAGGAYVPIDPSYPTARIQYMLADSAAPLLLTQSHLQAQLAVLVPDCVRVCLDEATFSNQPIDNPKVNRTAFDLAYVIYTSGSTGMPKGVMVEHHNLSNLLLDMQQRTFITTSDKLLAVTTLSFDIAALELYLPLISGSRLHLATRTTASDGLALQQQVVKHDISFMQATPATWQLLKQSGWMGNTSLNLLSGGEALPPEMSNYLLENSHFCWNVYGPTETTIWSSAYPIQTRLNAYPSIGQPIANTRIYILDAQHQPQPPCIPGELGIAGAGLARGYLNRPELTAEKFIEVELFGKTERIYKTGDLARWLPDGNLEYLGRIDSQVKLRGFRIELGEIEAVLSQHQAVKEAVVTLHEVDDNKRLVAYFTTDSSSNDEVPAIKDWLKARLPDYMIPSQFMVLEKLPLTPNGKIDRQALPAPEIETVTSVKPATPIEELLAMLWAAVLKREAINRHDNFFELGGHSLLATQLIARIRDSFQVELPVRAVFEHPTLSSLATLMKAATSTASLPPIDRQSASASKVLSFAQQRLWFLNQFEENNRATYNMPAALQLSGHLEVEVLQHSLHWLLERHDSLRTAFPIQSGQALVHIQPLSEIEVLSINDLRHLSSAEQNEEVQNRANSHAVQPFDLAAGPLFKADLLLLDESKSVLLLNMHHIISDGWSMGVFIRDWQHAYAAFAQGEQPSLPPLEIQYSDYAAWQRDWLQGEVLQQQVDYWLGQLAGIPELLELPTDKPRPRQQSYIGAHYSHRLSPALTTSLTGLNLAQGVSMFMTLLTTFDILLSRYSRQDDICVGSPIANRTHRQTEDIIGFFVNTLVLRGQIQPQQSFIDLLLETRQICLAAYAHQDIPFEMLVEQLQPTRSLSHSPLFQVMLVLQNNDSSELTLPGLDISALTPDYPIAKFDLTLNVEEQNGELHCLWEYATDLFDKETIERMAGHFEVLLTAIVDNPAQAISQLPMLTESETKQLLTWNDTATDYPVDKTIVDLFEQIVTTTPDNIAVVFENQQLTYQQLNEQANQLAHHLLALMGREESSNNPLIAIAVERSLSMVIGLLGILKAGGAYIPIDPSYPAARIQYMLEDSAAPLLLTQSHFKAQLPALSHDCVRVCLDEATFSNQPIDNPKVNRFATDLAYVIYTSGSTGMPKGAMNTHNGIVNRLLWMQDTYLLTYQDRILQKTPFSFDVSVWEFFWPLLTGASLVVAKPEGHKDPAYLSEVIAKYEVTVLHFVPSMLSAFISHAEVPNCSSLKRVICSGEALSFELIQQFLARFADLKIELHNLYGPTEAAVDVSHWQCRIFDTHTLVPIGKPVANTQLYVLDVNHQMMPIGVPGELCIGGIQVGSGYLNRPELTAEKFIEVELFGKTERIYKTGDLARWLPDGNLEYLGRIDSQVKLRGFRIELGEIEAVLTQHEAVKEAVVILFDSDDNKRLVAYLTTESVSNAEVSAIKDWLKARLPDYMIPSQFMVLEKLPLTPNGKIDRKALPTPEAREANKHYQAPRDTIELQLAQIWEDVLKVRPIGITDNFFELGGHSLLAVRLMAQIEQQFNKHLSLAALFQNATIEQLANQLRLQTDSQTWSSLVAIQPNGTKPPFFGVPGIGGNVLYFYELAQHLGPDQPVYGLQAVGLDGKSAPFTTIEEMAAHYLQELQRIQPQGPYLLGGHSFGGLVAFEMSLQLQKQGHEVAFLGIFDKIAPPFNAVGVEWDETQWLHKISQFLERELGQQLEFNDDKLQSLNADAQLNYLNEQLKKAHVIPTESSVTQLRGLVNVFKANSQISYAPLEITKTPITLFKAKEARGDVFENEPTCGWHQFSESGVSVQIVPGDHFSMMKKPHVQIFAAQLKEGLEQAEYKL